MKKISVVTPCFNEEKNVCAVYEQVKEIFSLFPHYEYEHIFIDNASDDNTVSILTSIAKNDKNVKIIINSRNFGHIRSPYHGLMQATGDAVIALVADLQNPPAIIKDFIQKWEQGYKIVLGVKKNSEETFVMKMVRKAYYSLVNFLSEVELTKNYMGFGLYDRQVIDILRELDDPYPYFRGLIADIGFKSAKIEYIQPARKRGITKNNFYTLYDIAILGIINHSKIPIRIATILGFLMSLFCFVFSICYLCYKLIWWDSFDVGIAPIVIGLFLVSSVQLFFLGVVGEYIANIHTQIMKRPLVIEEKRINFD